MFNDDCNPQTNGEKKFFLSIEDKISVIFDVGCRTDSEFTAFKGEVHYFDPRADFIEILSKQPRENTLSYFNSFGLGNENGESYYYPNYQSFYNRINSCGMNDESNKITLQIRKAKDYISENDINQIDFLKIDTEGYEFDVLKGFEDCLENVKIIQFEYGGTFLDNGIKLVEVIDYLKEKGFYKFSYLTSYGTEPIVDTSDHYHYCNIVCVNKKYDLVPF